MRNHISLTIKSAAVVAWLAMLQPADAQERTLGGGLTVRNGHGAVFLAAISARSRADHSLS